MTAKIENNEFVKELLAIDLNSKPTFEICEKATEKLNRWPQDLHTWPLKRGD